MEKKSHVPLTEMKRHDSERVPTFGVTSVLRGQKYAPMPRVETLLLTAVVLSSNTNQEVPTGIPLMSMLVPIFAGYWHFQAWLLNVAYICFSTEPEREQASLSRI